MTYRVRLRAVILLVALTCLAFAFLGEKAARAHYSTDVADTEEKKRVTVKVKLSAEGNAVLPSGSKIQWEGIGDTCKKISGEKAVQSAGETTMTIPVCKVKLTMFITGFDTKAIVVDVASNAHRYSNPIRITVKRQGPAEFAW